MHRKRLVQNQSVTAMGTIDREQVVLLGVAGADHALGWLFDDGLTEQVGDGTAAPGEVPGGVGR